MTFEYDNHTYSYIQYNSALFNVECLPKRKDYKQSKYLDMGCGFDIETSRIPDEHKSFMYMWQFAINEQTIIGRTWEEFDEFIQIITQFYETNKKPLLVWIHNMSFEWSFIKRRLKWKYNKRGKCSVFALERRKVIKALTESGIEFRDSLIVTQMSLSQMAKSFELDIHKLPGEVFDYDELRFSDTPLNNGQLAYGINDVQILQKWYHKYIKQEFIKKHIDIPLTATSIVRGEIKRAFKHVPKKERNKYLRMIQYGFPDKEKYEVLIRWLYRGGMTHANVGLTGVKWENIGLSSYDIKSSYPSTLCHELFPYEFAERPVEWFYKYGFDNHLLETVAYYGTFVFNNIRAKTTFSLESENKIIQYSKDAVFDNGRLVKASQIVVILNEVDMKMYRMIYNWGDNSSIDEIECSSIFRANKHRLPKFILDTILKYYYLKESLPSGYERDCVKRKLNSVYGYFVSGLFHTQLNFNENTGMFDDVGNSKSFEQIVKKEIVTPYVGIWCTSYSRYRLVKAMCQCDSHHNVYNDTDSSYILNSTGCEWVFKAHNDLMERINKTMYVGDYDRKYFMDMGKFECENPKIFRYKTLGCKRYIYSVAYFDKDKNKYYLKDKVTIAGMKKGSLQKYCAKEELDIYDAFDNNLELLPEDSDKLTSVYEDSEFTREIDGHIINEKSCVTLIPIKFKMKMTVEYLEIINAMMEHNSRVYGR